MRSENRYHAPEDFYMEDNQFFEAALNGDVNTVTRGLSEGQSPNKADPEARTPLMLAAFNGHEETVCKLLAAGAKVNRVDQLGRTALMFASTGPFPGTVTHLLDSGAEVNLADRGEGWTPLMWAAAEGNTEVVKVLLRAGADKHMKDKDSDTAFDFAKQKGHEETARVLAT